MLNTQLEKVFHQLLVFFFCLSSLTQHVVQVPDTSSHVFKNCDHHFLKNKGGISQSEWHECIFKQSLLGAEAGLPLVSRSTVDEVVAIFEIESGKLFAYSSFVKEF